MRIGIDARMYSPKFTGIGRYVYELTQNLFKLDHENEYILFLNSPEYEAFTPPNDRVSKVLAAAPHYSLKEQTKFLFQLYFSRLDLMHFTHFNAPILYFRPSVVTIHDLTLSFFPGNKMNSLLHRAAYYLTLSSAVKKARKVIAVSQNTKYDLQKVTHVPASKIEVIYEGVNPQFHHISDPKTIKNCLNKYRVRQPFLLYTGVWRSHKNLPNLIKAFHLLRAQYGLDFQLVITGRKDPIYPEIERETLSLQLENDIIFTGLVPEDDLIALYSAAQVYVFPSMYEGFGLPVLEAMQCHTPVACSRASCLPEIAGRDNAVFFDPHSPEDMAEKIYTLYSDKALADRLILNGVKHVKNFSWPRMALETLKIYQSLHRK